jgi:hypothetical protein
MPPSPKQVGRPLTVAGLRVVCGVFVVIVVLMMFCAYGLAPRLTPLDSDASESMISILATVAMAEALLIWIIRWRLRPMWIVQLQAQRYQPGGAVPAAYGTALIVGAALAQGLGLFGSTVYLMTRKPEALGFAGLAVVFILMQLPNDSHLLREQNEED